jgi:hypothetical protein
VGVGATILARSFRRIGQVADNTQFDDLIALARPLDGLDWLLVDRLDYFA